MTARQYGKNFSGKLTIQRVHEYELDVAIEDLEKRGYVLEKRGVDEAEKKSFDYHERKGQKLRFAESATIRKCWAVLRKVVEE